MLVGAALGSRQRLRTATKRSRTCETNSSYDVLLADILMPGMDGLALLGRLRFRHPGIPVVIMTVKNTPEHVLGSLRREAAAYIGKPFSRDALLGTLQNALSASVSDDDIKILSDKPNWISLQIRCRLATADRLTQFVRELPSDLDPESARTDRHCVPRTAHECRRARRPSGPGEDRRSELHPHRAHHRLLHPRPRRRFLHGYAGPRRHREHRGGTVRAIWQLRQQMGIRPGGFGLLMTKSFADELIYSAKGNEVILIKYLLNLETEEHS